MTSPYLTLPCRDLAEVQREREIAVARRRLRNLRNIDPCRPLIAARIGAPPASESADRRAEIEAVATRVTILHVAAVTPVRRAGLLARLLGRRR